MEQQQYPFKIIVSLFGTMLGSEKVINNSYLETIINIYGDKGIFCEIDNRKFYRKDGQAIKIINIIIEGASHYIFDQPQYWPLIIGIILRANNEKALRTF